MQTASVSLRAAPQEDKKHLQMTTSVYEMSPEPK